MALNIKKSYILNNITTLKNRKVEWIVLHYTAGTSSKSGTALNISKWFNNPLIKASADFVVDDKNVYQLNNDIKNKYTWHSGGNKYSTMTTKLGGKYYGIAKNSNSIGIEMCSSKKNTKTLHATDTDWYFTDAVIDNTVELVKYLMKKYNIDKDHVIMHHSITGKICPNPWVVNSARLKGYYDFLDRLEEKKEYKVKVTKKDSIPVREKADSKSKEVIRIKKGEVYTIVEEVKSKDGKTFGKLKSGSGYINLSYVTKL